MANSQKHRGPHPGDEKLFAPSQLPQLYQAVEDMSWLLTKGYSSAASLKLVGDRFRLAERQRKVVMRAACTDQEGFERKRKQIDPSNLMGKDLWIDGFNVLISLETALSGGYLFTGRDGVLRDNSSVHGSYRQVSETLQCIAWVGEFLMGQGCSSIHWLLDQPVSNSGRLLTAMYELAEAHGWNWKVELVPSPDAVLKQVTGVVATSDAIILQQAQSWIDLPSLICSAYVPSAKIYSFVPLAK